METYTRIIPRDLFNESKLLKCIGRLCLLIHDKLIPCKMDFDETGERFNIEQDENDGGLFISNLEIRIKGNPFDFKTHYNNKANYPLFLIDEDYSEHLVFDEDGNFTKEFKAFCKTVKAQK